MLFLLSYQNQTVHYLHKIWGFYIFLLEIVLFVIVFPKVFLRKHVTSVPIISPTIIPQINMYYQCNHKNNQNKHTILLSTLFELWFSCTFSEILKKDKWLRKLRIIVQKQPSRGVLRKSVPKISSEFTEEHPCRSLISLKLQTKTNNIFHSISRKEFVTQQLLKAITQNFAGKVLHHGLFLWIYSVFFRNSLNSCIWERINSCREMLRKW